MKQQSVVDSMLQTSEYLAGHAMGISLAANSPEQARAAAREVLEGHDGISGEGVNRLLLGFLCGVTSTVGLRAA